MNFSQPSAVRTINRLRVLDLLRTAGPMSRADIAKALSLNKPSTSEIVASLIAENLVEELEKKQTAVGRKPTPVAICRTGRYMLAVDIEEHACSLAVADLAGNLLRWERIPTPANPDVKKWCVDAITKLRHISRSVADRLGGCVISVDGEISSDRKTLLSKPEWGWKDIPLATVFERNMKTPTLLADNAGGMAMAERWFSGRKDDAFLYVNWGEHIKNVLVNGPRTTIGQMGHMKVADGGKCRCGGTGCLETVASGWALSAAFGGKPVKQLCEEQPEGFDAKMKEACRQMGRAIASSCAVTGITRVVFAGGLSLAGAPYQALVGESFRKALPPSMKNATLMLAAAGVRSGILGAVAAALDAFVYHTSLLVTLS